MVARRGGSRGDGEEKRRIAKLIERAGLPVKVPAIGAQRMRAAMGMDKKVLGNQLRFVLLDRLGNAITTSSYDEARLEKVLEASNG